MKSLKSVSGKEFQKADAFLNLVIVDKNGTEYRFKGIPLTAENRAIEKALVDSPEIVENLSRDQIKLSVVKTQKEVTPEF